MPPGRSLTGSATEQPGRPSSTARRSPSGRRAAGLGPSARAGPGRSPALAAWPELPITTASLDASHHALAGPRTGTTPRRGSPARLGRGGDDRGGQGMLARAPAWPPGGAARLVLAGGRSRPRRAAASLRSRAGLVDDQRVDPLEDLERLGILHEDASAGAPARAHHDRHRRGQAQCAGAGDDQHRHRVDQGMGHRGCGPKSPRRRT